ncbi:hypothetical protein K505DRAFT_90018 [Melanomma pulvis-pyrius CBS 109.77]|uniref:Uncharacterized protein n=1 Tax=Melanomma pulvis-pyrius CBS 109.77 TaxID=1314802 RepID=A0A6A6XSX8_9PLEO|nr:hypothetical protein K505DRAFT_90018 [Melanomma pulvis-pyrius CBS 109.77]
MPHNHPLFRSIASTCLTTQHITYTALLLSHFTITAPAYVLRHNSQLIEHINIFNLLGLNRHTSKLRLNDPSIIPLDGVSVTLISAFRSELFNMLHPSAKHGEEPQDGDVTLDCQSLPRLWMRLTVRSSTNIVGHVTLRITHSNWLGADLLDG